MNGLNPEPGASYALQDRFVCDKCQISPDIVKATAKDGNVSVTLRCHGETHSQVYERRELVFTQHVFSTNGDE